MKTLHKTLGVIPIFFGVFHVEFPVSQSKNVAFKRLNGCRNSHSREYFKPWHEFPC